MIETERLRLSPLSRAQAEHIIAGERTGQPWAVGYPRSDDQDVARMFLTAPPAEDGFGPLQIVDRRTALVIGGIGFFGPPDALGLVELGYGVAPEVEGRGYATEALRALLAWAYRTGRVTRAIAVVRPPQRRRARVGRRAPASATASSMSACSSPAVSTSRSFRPLRTSGPGGGEPVTRAGARDK
ncbi:GNAT family N-acetyltransferase [Micromonospora chersina]